MKNVLLFLFTIILLTSCVQQKSIKLIDNTYITKKQEKRILDKAFKNAFNSLNKTEKKILTNSNIQIEYGVK